MGSGVRNRMNERGHVSRRSAHRASRANNAFTAVLTEDFALWWDEVSSTSDLLPEVATSWHGPGRRAYAIDTDICAGPTNRATNIAVARYFSGKLNEVMPSPHVPTPMQDPFIAIRAASPPEEPPGVR